MTTDEATAVVTAAHVVTADGALDNRPRLTYPGDVTEVVGQVVGPGAFGEYFVVDEVRHDADAGTSLALLRWPRPGEVAHALERRFW